MIDAKIVERFILNSMAVVVMFSGICSITTKICDSRFELVDDIIIVSNNNTDEENEVQIDISNFIFNQFNSSENKLVFNSSINFANSLSIKQIDFT